MGSQGYSVPTKGKLVELESNIAKNFSLSNGYFLRGKWNTANETVGLMLTSTGKMSTASSSYKNTGYGIRCAYWYDVS